MLDIIATPVATVLKAIHGGLSTFLAPSSGPAWALSIVLLTVFVRLLLFPLFVKQIKSQRRMQEIAPKIKELQKLHKGDRETLNTEMMKLYKVHNANPISGCLPLILQLPVFFALFTVIREFKPGATAKYGLSAADLGEGGRAQVFGAPLSAAFNSPLSLLQTLGGSVTTVRIVAVVMLVLMGSTTFWTQRQMMARNTTTDATQMQVQKVLLYVLPLSFAVFGFSFPIGVLLYWLTTNIWSMGQQAWVIKRMPPIAAPGGATGSGGPGRGGGTGSRPAGPKPGAPKDPATKDPASKDPASKDGAPSTGDTGRVSVIKGAGRGAASLDKHVPASAAAPSAGAGGSGRVGGSAARPQNARRKKGRPGGRR